MAKAKSLVTPALAKKNMVAASLKPRPPMDMGKSVIAPITGKSIKKYNILIFIPKDKAVI
jgi:hypothetical protein